MYKHFMKWNPKTLFCGIINLQIQIFNFSQHENKTMVLQNFQVKQKLSLTAVLDFGNQ